MITLATPADVVGLVAIECAAVELFRDDPVYPAFVASAASHEDHLAAIAAGRVWVYRDAPSSVAGFVVVDVRDGEGYLEEVDVLPTFGRRGIGSALIAHACEWARARRLPSIALSTFRDLPWNAPLYARLGFVEAHPLTPALLRVQAHEATLGFPMARRVIMRRLL